MEDLLLDDSELGLTNQNFEYAGFWNRAAAIFIDGIIIGIPMKVLETFFNDSQEGIIIVGLLGFIVRWLYFALQESSPAQATIGKKALGIKVVDLNGNQISFAKATGRYFGKIISSAILFIGFFMAGFTEKKQALHDMMAGTLVIKD